MSEPESVPPVVGKLLSNQPPPFPKEIVLLGVDPNPVFPGMVLPLTFKAQPYQEIFDDILEKRFGFLGICLRRKKDDLFNIGCLSKVVRVFPLDQDQIQVIVNVTTKIKLLKTIAKEEVYIARIEPFKDGAVDSDDETKGYVSLLITKIKELIKLNSIFSEEMKIIVSRYASQSVEQLTYLLCGLLTSPSPHQLQELLEMTDFKKRLLKLLNYLQSEVEIFKVKDKISKQIESNVSQQQRDFFLKEQLKYIQKELGLEKDERAQFNEELKQKLAESKLSEEAKQVVKEEMKKLNLYEPRSAEYSVTRNYIELIFSLPWEITTEENDNLKKAERILNQHHYGLEKVKKRLLEFVAVSSLRKTGRGSILCLVGPPGVGKTSLGMSIATVLNRPFYRFSLGGMRDEAEIKGHRRTYIGAMPGKIIKALKNAKAMNPVIMLDEIDKLSSGFQGDPSAALLEVLDPQQNANFIDHYLDFAFDLSKVFFIATANQLDTIPPPLLDRMEVIRISGYIFQEKKKIAEKYLIKKQIKEHGLDPKKIQFKPKAIDEIIEYYARDPGVRTLEKDLKSILRKIAFKQVQAIQNRKKGAKEKTSTKSKTPLVVSSGDIEGYLGNRRFDKDLAYDNPVPGIVCGLAWTSMGGSTLYIESIVVRKLEGEKTTSGRFRLTGQLGKVMQESAEIAYSYVKSILPDYLKNGLFFDQHEIHLHVPSGAVPKDGPSAGVTMALALFSLAINRKVPALLAMTGELSLSGKILPIGGVQEKLIAAKRSKKKIIYLPLENKKDLPQIDQNIIKNLKISYLDHFSQVIELTFKSLKKISKASVLVKK